MAEKEYIERMKVISVIKGYEIENCPEKRAIVQDITDDVMKIPAADVVEVVRCKDCKWWHTGGCAFRKDCTADLPSADDFCSHGERKEQK